MSGETVTVTPGGVNWDEDGNPTPTGTRVTIPARAVAPGNTTFTPEVGGELEAAEYTVYLDLGAPIANDDAITVRGKLCWARIKEWRSPWTGRGGLEVLCKAVTGAGPRA